jgi:hypothetical protein
MTEMNRMRGLCTAAVFVVAAALSGCSAGDVELNGSVFDTLGIGSKTANANTAKVPERQGLVLPPNLERLPEPGSGALAAQQGNDGLPVDPEQKRAANATQAQVKHNEYCERALQKARIMKDLSPVNGPLGRCDKSIFDQVNVQGPVSMTTGSTESKGLPR